MRYLLYVLLLTAISCSGLSKLDKTQAEDDIREAVFRFQFNANGKSLGRPAHVYCLSASEDSLSDAFMRRFEGHVPPVKRRSRCRR